MLQLRSATSFQQYPSGIQTQQLETMIGASNFNPGMNPSSRYSTLPAIAKEAEYAGQLSPQPASGYMDPVNPGRSQDTYIPSSPTQQPQQLSYLAVRDLSIALNPTLELGNDWRMLAGIYKMSHGCISALEKNKNPTGEVVKHIYQTKPATRPEDIARVLRQMDRVDAAMIIETYLRESPEPMSTGASSSGGSSPENNSS